MTTSAALDYATLPHMIVASDLLGPLTVDAGELIGFRDGLLGFPDCHGFVLVATERDGVYWLQSADHSALAFLLVDPFPFFPGYVVDVPDPELAELGAEEPTDVAVLAIVTLPRSREELPTANLQGPLALNLRERRAKQLALDDGRFGLREPLDFLRAGG